MTQKTKSKKLTLAISALLVISITLGGFFAFNFLPQARLSTHLGYDFAESVGVQIAAQGYVDFDQITDFEWSRLIIVTPYQDPWQTLERNGIRRQRMNSNIKFSDAHNLLIFLERDRIVAYIDLSRDTADFRGTIQDGHVFTRDNSVFFTFMSESFWGFRGVHLAHFDTGEREDLPLIRDRFNEIATEVRADYTDTDFWIQVSPLTDPIALARHWLSRAIFPSAPNSTILSVPEYEAGQLPRYIDVEIVSLSHYQGESPPTLPPQSIGNHNYVSGELLGLYTGTIYYVDSVAERLDGDWFAVFSQWHGRLYLVSE